jgi:peptide deformylase
MKRPLVHVPDPVLTTPAKTVVAFDKKLARLITDMKDSLVATRNPKGVGLAAPQIGEPWRIFVTRPKESDPIRVFINPEIHNASPERTKGIPERDNKMEGCLSIPKIWGNVKRAVALTLRYQDEKGNPHEESFKGFIATIIQHETDHINGILFTHRVLEQKEKLYQIGHDEKGQEVLEEIVLR